MKPFRIGAVVALALLVAGAAVLEAHDLFLRPRDFIVREGRPVEVRVLSGTWSASQGAVSPDRLRDLSVAGPAGVIHAERSAWLSAGRESHWTVKLGPPGTYVLAASLIPRTIRLNSSQFTEYLTEEGLSNVVAERKAAGIHADSARERYSKHIKALVRVLGSSTTRATADTMYRVPLGYPAELLPLEDPYRLARGDTLHVRALVDGAAVEGQTVLVGGNTLSGTPVLERQLRTDGSGQANVRLDHRGAWYLKFIRMRQLPASAGDSVDYESKWATLTFAVP